MVITITGSNTGVAPPLQYHFVHYCKGFVHEIMFDMRGTGGVLNSVKDDIIITRAAPNAVQFH